MQCPQQSIICSEHFYNILYIVSWLANLITLTRQATKTLLFFLILRRGNCESIVAMINGIDFMIVRYRRDYAVTFIMLICPLPKVQLRTVLS